MNRPTQCLRSIGGAMITAAVLFGCHRASEPMAASENRPTVTVAPVLRDTITQSLELTGEVRPLSTVLLTSKVPGRLERLGVEGEGGVHIPLSEGMFVRRGDVLARIDLDVYAARLKQAEAAVAMAKAQFQDAARDEKRTLALWADGSATEQMRDKAATARMIAEAAQTQAEAALALAKIEFGEATPRSPVNGIVTRKHVDEGNIVSVGMALATIEELSEVKVVLAVPERYLSSVEAGKTKVHLTSDALPDGGVEAVVSKVHPAVDPATRTGAVEIMLDNADGRFRSGSFVHVSLDVARAEEAVVIPLSAIDWQGPEAFVFVAADGRAHRRAVKVGIREQQRCQITAGLEAKETLVVDGFRNLRDGDAVATEPRGRP